MTFAPLNRPFPTTLKAALAVTGASDERSRWCLTWRKGEGWKSHKEYVSKVHLYTFPVSDPLESGSLRGPLNHWTQNRRHQNQVKTEPRSFFVKKQNKTNKQNKNKQTFEITPGEPWRQPEPEPEPEQHRPGQRNPTHTLSAHFFLRRCPAHAAAATGGGGIKNEF